VREALFSVDWDFPERIAHSEIEGIHPYPAKFVAQLPRAVLDSVPIEPGTAVLDPFCGSGTTLVECQRRGVRSVGIDLNPIACLMSRVKVSPLPANLEETARSTLAAAERISNPEIPVIPNLNHWFKKDIQFRLASLIEAIATASPETRDILRLALSSIIVRVSNQESDTRYAAIAKNTTAEDVFALFVRAVDRLAHVLRSRTYKLSPSMVIEGDTLQVSERDVGMPVGLVITSPPYPNAYEYWLYHKYRMWWLGLDPIAVKKLEIGARAHFFKRNHHTADDFVRQMEKTFSLLNRVVVPNGYACFVVGRSRIHGEIIDNARIIENAGLASGFVPVFSKDRVLSANRKSFNLSHANIKTETVLVLRRDVA
jgi:site-specific DNA-methyltransferase (cytosine-N4-specific)